MKNFHFYFLLLSFLFTSIVASAQRAKKIHFNSILIDTHNDIPTTAIDAGVSFDQSLKKNIA